MPKSSCSYSQIPECKQLSRHSETVRLPKNAIPYAAHPKRDLHASPGSCDNDFQRRPMCTTQFSDRSPKAGYKQLALTYVVVDACVFHRNRLLKAGDTLHRPLCDKRSTPSLLHQAIPTIWLQKQQIHFTACPRCQKAHRKRKGTCRHPLLALPGLGEGL